MNMDVWISNKKTRDMESESVNTDTYGLVANYGDFGFAGKKFPSMVEVDNACVGE